MTGGWLRQPAEDATVSEPAERETVPLPWVDRLLGEAEAIRKLPYPHPGRPTECEITWREALRAVSDRLVGVLGAELDRSEVDAHTHRVLAAELRRWADLFDVRAEEIADEDNRHSRSLGMAEAARCLRARADELDGGAR